MTYSYRICFETNEPQTTQAIAMQYAFQNIENSGIGHVLSELGLPGIENPDVVLDEIIIEHDKPMQYIEALECAKAQPGYISFKSWDLLT